MRQLLKMLKTIINLPRLILGHTLNILIAIPFVFIGLLIRQLAEWLVKKTPKPRIEFTDAEIDAITEFYDDYYGSNAELIDDIEPTDDELFDIEVEPEEDLKDETIH